MADTIFNMNFDFTSAGQREILQYLQQNNWQLLGFKGAKGPNQVTAGVPTWFAVPFGNMFGETNIDYEPLYKVYVYNSAKIAAYTTISMQSLSDEIALGNGLVFNQDGSFAAAGSAPAGTISLKNNRPASTAPVTVGLAAKVSLPSGSVYQPFCAFTLTPQASINMEPLEDVLLMAAQTDLQSGNVQANAAAPGASFTFTEAALQYKLAIADATYQVEAAPGGLPVTSVESGATLTQLLNS